MNRKLDLALLLLNFVAFSMAATCSNQFFEDEPMDMEPWKLMDMEPWMSMPGIAPFPKEELQDLMLDVSSMPGSDENQNIASLVMPGFPIPVKYWSKTFGGTSNDCGYSFQETTDGGYIIAGYAYSYGSGNGDVWLIKTDSSGNKYWDKTFGGSNSDYGNSVQGTTDGGYIIAGQTASYGAGNFDVWLIKTNSAGDEMWNNTFGGTSFENGYYVQETNDGGYVIAGYTESYGAVNGDVWLIKTNSAGDEMWNRTFGGTAWDQGRSVQQTSDGGYVIAGTTELGAWLIKTDSAGNEMWNKTFGGTDSDWGNSVQQTSDDGYVIVGITNSYGAGNDDVWLIKTDSAGDEKWNKTFGGTDSELGYSVQQTNDGGYVIAGTTGPIGAGNGDVWLIKTDSAGDEMWNKTFGGTSYDCGFSVRETSDGGYVIAGYTYSYGAGNFDVWLIKTEPLPTMYYPDFREISTGPNQWQSWLVIQNPASRTANVYIVLRSRTGVLLYSGGSTIAPFSVSVISPRDLVGSDCSGSAVITSDISLKGTCEISGMNRCMSYTAIGSE